MSFNHGLTIGDTINNNQLTGIFKCGPQGGMRRSRTTNTLVVVSNHTRAIYEDRWIDDEFHYTGMGLEGDQRLDYAQNKTLFQLSTNGVECYLFEVFIQGSYVFRGHVELASTPYQEDQPDINGTLRKAWIFPLKLIEKGAPPLPATVIKTKQDQKEREARRLSLSELKQRAQYSRKGVGIREVSSKTFERNAYVSELVKRFANDICQLCDNPAPFQDKKGRPFLESHHIVWLSEGGEDTVENSVALCPNCHRKMHVLNLESDVFKLKTRAIEMSLSLDRQE